MESCTRVRRKSLVHRPSIARSTNKVIVTCSLPMNDDNTDLVIAHTSSGAEQLAKKIPKARVVCAFSTVPSEVLFGVYEGKRNASRPSLVYCGDALQLSLASCTTETLLESLRRRICYGSLDLLAAPQVELQSLRPSVWTRQRLLEPPDPQRGCPMIPTAYTISHNFFLLLNQRPVSILLEIGLEFLCQPSLSPNLCAARLYSSGEGPAPVTFFKLSG
jgi:hypothetical protein